MAATARRSAARSRTLIPIAAAYVVAHYFSLLAYNGQDLWRLASDPLGDGSDLLGGADGAIDYSVIGATAIWYGAADLPVVPLLVLVGVILVGRARDRREAAHETFAADRDSEDCAAGRRVPAWRVP